MVEAITYARSPAFATAKRRTTTRSRGLVRQRLAALRRCVAHAGHERRYIDAVPFEMHPLGRRRVIGERRAGTVLGCGPDRPSREAAPAIRTDIAQHHLHAVGAESAFIAADPGIGRVRWQVLVATFAVRSQLQHARTPDQPVGSYVTPKVPPKPAHRFAATIDANVTCRNARGVV